MIFVLLLTSIEYCNGQGGEAAQASQLVILNGLKSQLLAAQKTNDKIRIQKISEQIILVENTIEKTEQIYKHYQNAVRAVETVSTTIKTSIEVKEFWEDAFEVCKIYSEYGISIKLESIYDLDKYINPDEHKKYMRMLEEIYYSVLNDVEDIKMLTGTSVNSLYADKIILRATEYERWMEVGKVIRGTRTKLHMMKRVVMKMQYLAPAKNKDIDNNIAIKKSFYNINTYER